MAVVTVTTVAVIAPSCGPQRRPGGGDAPSAHLTGGVIEPPIRSRGRLEQAQLAGAGGLERVAV
jgi:hypothetical protein